MPQSPPASHSYTISYHVNNVDLAQGLPGEAARGGVRLRALLIVGPVRPLWTFNVIAFLEDGEVLRVNYVVMPYEGLPPKPLK
jgi:hypothetical protein